MIQDFVVLLLVASFCVCQEYNDEDYSEIETTLEAGSREVFNITFRKKPERIFKLLNGNRLKDAEVSRKVKRRKPSHRQKLEISEPETTQRTKAATTENHQTSKPILRIETIKSKTVDNNERAELNDEQHYSGTKPRPLEPNWVVEPAIAEPIFEELFEETTEPTEETTKATRKTRGFSNFKNKRFRSVDKCNEKVTQVNEKQRMNTQVNHASEERKEPLGYYPFAVSIQKMGSHYASGALVDKRWVLSVAGEFYNVRESIKIYRARLGSMDCKRGGSLVPLKRIEIHPAFVPGKPNYDIAMIRLALLVDFTDLIHPIGLTKIKDKVLSAKFLTIYWPRVVIKGEVLPSTAKEREKHNSMRISTQRLIPWDKCYQKLNLKKEVLAESSLCLRPVFAHHTACLPDAGAAVVANDGLWGITSGWVSEDCAAQPSPAVVARVSSPPVSSWLNSLLLAPEN